MSEPHQLTRTDARRIALRGQLLVEPRPTDLLDVVRHLTILQTEPTSAVAPSADLVLWSRLGAAYDAGDLRDSVLKLLLVEARSHPFAVVRAAELRRWVDSGEYTRCLTGAYPRRDTDAEAGVSEAAKDAARSYSETFRQSQDAVGKLVHDAAGFLGSAKLWLDDVLRRGEE